MTRPTLTGALSTRFCLLDTSVKRRSYLTNIQWEFKAPTE